MRKGQRHSPEAIEKLRAARARQVPWNKGKSVPRTGASRRKQAETVRAKWADPDWREARGKTVVTYSGMHLRLWRLSRRQKLVTCRADEVGLPKCNRLSEEWAIHHDAPEEHRLHDDRDRLYSMDVEDYVRLCKSCHSRYDGKGNPELGGMFRRQDHGRAKLTYEDVDAIRARRSSGEKLSALAKSFGVSVSQVWKIVSKKQWKVDNEGEDSEHGERE